MEFIQKVLKQLQVIVEDENSSLILFFNLSIQKWIFYGSANTKSNKISSEQQLQNHQCLQGYYKKHICQSFQKFIYFIKSNKCCHRKCICKIKRFPILHGHNCKWPRSVNKTKALTCWRKVTTFFLDRGGGRGLMIFRLSHFWNPFERVMPQTIVAL